MTSSYYHNEEDFTPADKVLHASTNGLYLEAQKLDRGHADNPCPAPLPAGVVADDTTCATTRVTPDAVAHASDSAEADGATSATSRHED